MNFRGRLIVSLLIAALVPLLVFALGVRRELSVRLEHGEEVANRQAVAHARESLSDEATGIETRLDVIARDLARDTRTLRALAGDTSARRWLIDYAASAASTAGLGALMLQDSSGTVLSSSQFRNLYGQQQPLLPHGDSAQVWLVRTPAGTAPALARTAAVVTPGRTLLLSGGTMLDSLWLASLSPDTSIGVALRLPGDSAPAHTGIAELALPLPGGAADGARIVLWRRSSNVAALRNGVSQRLATALALSGILAAALALLLGARMSRPLRELTERAERVDVDHLDEDFASGRGDEIGRLSTALGAMQHRLGRSVAQLRDAERRAATGDLARQVNHDIKNGLAPIRNVLRHLSELAAGNDATALQEVYREREATLTASVAHLEEMARNYAQLSPSITDGSSVVAHVLAEVVRDLGDARVTVDISDAAATAAVTGDEPSVRRILHNLISNAIESLPDHSGTVIAAVEDGANTVAISITDTGRGMSAGELDRAFRDFHTTKESGTGLGLSSVRRLVMELNGSLRASSSPGAGSRFDVSLPRAATRDPRP
ncbi:MAG TPA: HAMP domain-containing sensor histidine kinase [Gemmatimonadales bacterium]|jgi:signal transduction histidine kinase|nr:HAMP domain-containing sensor histidine kinase [Gemmatimonadales bacterium]